VKNSNLNESYISSSFNTFLEKIYKVEVIRESGNFTPVTVKTFLGDILKPGTNVIGYDITNLVLDELEEAKNIPEILLVRR
jgi:nonsense-mediated mRNA decay protein 3